MKTIWKVNYYFIGLQSKSISVNQGQSQAAEDLMQRFERCSQRYIDNEKFIVGLNDMPLWKRIFFWRRIILKHTQAMLKKYPD